MPTRIGVVEMAALGCLVEQSGRLARLGVLLCGAVAFCAAAATPRSLPALEHMSHGRFQNVAIYAPAGTPTSFVLFLSGEKGWNSSVDAIAQQLVSRGAMVAGIDVPKLIADFEADGADCVFPDGDLENLSHFLQAYYHLPTYLPPFLVGYGEGASLAYASLVQAPADTFAGALSLGFCPTLNMHKPLCKGSGAEFVRRPGEKGVEVLPAKRLESPWVLIEGARDQVCPVSPVRAFVAGMPGAALVVLPQATHEYAAPATWAPQFLAAFDTLVRRASSKLAPPPPAGLGALPVIEIPAQPGTAAVDALAIILSGDGGWAGLDKEVALALSQQGIPVVGLDSLRYFWNARTPDGLAADVDRMIRYYLAHLHKSRVLLIGYSQGADVLPFAVNRLPAATRARVALAALIGMSPHALFEFHVSSWISDDNSGPTTLPEVNRISGTRVLCIYGEDEHDSLCPQLDSSKVRVVKLKGGHHFDGDYAGLAREILAAVGP
jgi:type IV secretory pathway VirJ component